MPPQTPGALTPPKQEVPPPHSAKEQGKGGAKRSTPLAPPAIPSWIATPLRSSQSFKRSSLGLPQQKGLWGWSQDPACSSHSLLLAPSTTYSLMVELGMAVSEISGSFSGQVPAPATGRNFNSETKNLALGS